MTRRGRLAPSVVDHLEQAYPEWGAAEPLCRHCAAAGRASVAEERLEERMGEVTQLDETVLDAIRTDGFVSADQRRSFEESLSTAERLAFRLTERIGSWTFAIGVVLVLLLWLLVNIVLRPFDNFPTLMLAVVSAALGSLAAIQGPIILMAQRRQQRWNRLQAEHEYLLNLKAELEIRFLDEKIDRLIALMDGEQTKRG